MDQDERMISSYLAGALDGDGSFSIIRRTIFNSEKRRLPRYRPCLQLYSLSQEIVDLLFKHLGGNKGKRKPQKQGWQPQVYWYCTGLESCEKAINKIVNFLVIKKERATRLLQFIKRELSIGDNRKIGNEVLLDRDNDYLEIKEINSRRDAIPDQLISKPTLSTFSPLCLAYIAGLIDTDGSIQLSRSIKPGKKNFSYEARIVIQMQSIKGINFCMQSTTCGHSAIINSSGKTNQKFLYRWAVTNKEELVLLLDKLHPYLTYRKQQAEVLVSFLEQIRFANQYDEKSMKKQHEIREYHYLLLKNLNKYGSYNPSVADLEVQEQGDKAESGSCGDLESK